MPGVRLLSAALVAIATTCLSDVFQRVEASGSTRPVVGVLAQELDWYHPYPPYKTYIMTDYAAYLQQSGAQVVPLMINQSTEYYRKLMGRLNGVLLPGGAVSLQKSPYSRASKVIFDIAKSMNDKGDYFPLWGTCLGFELLHLVYFTPAKNVLSKCSGTEGVYTAVNFTKESKNSRLFQSMTPDLKKIMASEQVTGNYHTNCMPTASYSHHPGLKSFYSVLTTNVDANGLEFSSTVEAVDYPIYGTQWHPEKDNYWWLPLNMEHTYSQTLVSQYFSNFFVNECRKSEHSFGTPEELAKAVIQNYRRQYRLNACERYLFK